MWDESRWRNVRSKFHEIYGGPATIWVQAPGRVDLMGSHTDYNDGFVLTQAIDRNTWIAARPRNDGRVRVASLNVDGQAEFALEHVEFDQNVPWTNYVRGVASVLLDQGWPLQGFDGLIHSSVPFGSGLSSSAALEVAVAVLFDRLGQLDLNKVDMALVCQRAENEFVGLNCGILDQYSSLMGESGRVVLLDCRQLTSRTVPFADSLALVVCDTRSKRKLTGSEYSERRAQCEEGVKILSQFYSNVRALRDVSLEQLHERNNDLPEVVARRCQYIVEENTRVLEMADAMAGGDHAWIRRLTTASYTGARDLYEIVSPEMEQMMSAMMTSPGVIGARQAGAGFGGCMVAVVRSGQVDEFRESVHRRYHAQSGIEPDVYAVEAAAGAGPLPDRGQ